MKAYFVLALTALTALTAGAQPVNDIYIGTIVVESHTVILTRCDGSRNQYILKDTVGISDGPVHKLMSHPEDQPAPLYGEVIGAYEKHDGKNYLVVAEVENVTPGKSCHFMDLLKELENKQ